MSDRFSSAITSRRVMLPWARVHSSRVWSSSRCPPAARMSRSVIFSRPPRISAVCTTLDSRAKSIGRRDWGESSTWGSSPGERTFCTFSSSRRTALVSSMSRSGRCSSPRSKSTWVPGEIHQLLALHAHLPAHPQSNARGGAVLLLKDLPQTEFIELLPCLC